MIEVEIKIKTAASSDILKALENCGFVPVKCVRECDTYFDHPGYDVRKHDKALRIRQTTGLTHGTSETFLTYKGPKLDKVSMTREEIELPLTDGDAMQKILLGMGFVPMIPVDKTRHYLSKGEIHACVDDVQGLGSFLELEILAADESQREEKLGLIDAVLDELGLSAENTITTSYLSMLQ